MALVLADRVRESTLTTGTGTVTLVGPVTGYQTFAAIGDGNTTYYTISNPNGTEWEVGIGTYTAASKTLSRDTVLSSSNGGAKTSFSVGSKDVFVSYPAEKSINQDEVGNTFVPNLGATTPSSGVFTTLTGNSTSQFGRSSANYFQAVGAAANLSPEMSVLGSDTNIPFTIESKGTGAVNLVPGSRGVNVSNGQTVTAITRTAVGSGYTSIPTATVAPPTTAGGVQATATVSMGLSTASVASGGTGYSVNDVLTIATNNVVIQLTVTSVTAGAVTAFNITGNGIFSVLPSSPASVTGGTGTGATFNLLTYFVSSLAVATAGSGYVEQPTVTFSGGGGSGAAAYATVGAVPKIQSLASAMSFFTAGGEQVRIIDGAAATSYLAFRGSATSNPGISVVGSGTTNLDFSTQGSASLRFFTNTYSQEQFRVTHTASAVNYVQVTGNATTSRPIISAQGSDSNVGLNLASKGNRSISLLTNSVTAFEALSPASGVNYFTANGSVTSFTPSLAATGTDTNIAATFQSKGTGAINLAPGSSGVNVSNGNTVTAITRTGFGSGYTSIPSVAVTAPTTAGGVQATGSARMATNITPTIVNGGTGYTLNDTLTVVGGTGTAVTITVSGVSGGVITSVTLGVQGFYSVLPTNPVSVTGGTGSNATFNLGTWYVSGCVVDTAGSGYVEQPTVSFSGGGGSGAAAYAVVGSSPKITSIAGSLAFALPSGEALRITNSGASNVNFANIQGNATTGSVLYGAGGADANINVTISSLGTGSVRLSTNNTAQEQLRVSHTASAVNFVLVTGAATTATPTISSQGSDTNVSLNFASKGTGVIRFYTAAGSSEQFRVLHTAGTIVNYAAATGSATGAAPAFSVAGTDTNIDLALTPKGTGLVRFGTYVAGALTATGYINIKAADGTTYKVLVST